MLSENEEEGIAFLADLEINIDYETIGLALLEHFGEDGIDFHDLTMFKKLDKNLTLTTPLLEKFLAAYYKEDADKAIQWIIDNPQVNGSESTAYELGVLSSKKQNPAGEIQLMLEADVRHEVKSNFLTGAMIHWVEQDIEDTFKFILDANLPAYYYDDTIYEMTTAAAAIEPDSAIHWADSLVDESYKKAAYSEVAAQWIKKDRDAFKVWFDKQDVSLQKNIDSDLAVRFKSWESLLSAEN